MPRSTDRHHIWHSANGSGNIGPDFDVVCIPTTIKTHNGYAITERRKANEDIGNRNPTLGLMDQTG